MVHFPGLSSPPYGFRWRYSGINLSGLPHSDILGSKPVCGSPKLFAAYHVLHRLLAPRHSPHALSSLTIRNSKLTPIAGSRVRQLAGSNVPNREPAGRETRHAIAPCTLRVPASTLTGVGGYNVQPSPSRAPAERCGRKKLPFAGYSVVKEPDVRSYQLPARELSALGSAACATSFTPHVLRALHSGRTPVPAPCRSRELAILTPLDDDCKLSRFWPCSLSALSSDTF